jgi:hypothetical protein
MRKRSQYTFYFSILLLASNFMDPLKMFTLIILPDNRKDFFASSIGTADPIVQMEVLNVPFQLLQTP